jgi:N-acetylglucosamine-6-phosphate deacetylase
MAGLRGLVDVQVNGFQGVDFSSPELTEDDAVRAIRALVADGTALLLPTLITAPEAVYARNLPLLARIMARPEFAPHLPGFHLEGPFLCGREGAIGSHNPGWVSAGDPAYLDRLQRWSGGRIRLITIAPDIAGAIGLIVHARQLGITVALGHHLATTAEMAAATGAGATCLTHLGNGLPHLINRHSNPLIDGLADDRLIACIIGDGHHLPWNLVKVMLRAKGIGRCALVSDASSLAGLPPGSYPCFGSTAVITEQGRIFNADSGYLMGSSCTIRRVVNATRRALGLDDAALHRLAVINPLRVIGLQPPAGLAPLPRADDGDWLPA